jgi:diacylglycerol kinase family enzyme
VNGEVFLNTAGAGFDAVVADTVNRQFRSLHGTLPYMLAVFQTLIQYRNAPLTIKLESHPPMVRKTLLIAVGNMQYYGGGICICPRAIPTDGLLDFCIAGDLNKAEVVHVLPKTFHGKHLSHRKCDYIQAKSALHGVPILGIDQAQTQL